MHQTANHCRLLRKERQALEKHARKKGCRLIINPWLTYRKWGVHARIRRLEWLVKFINSMPPGKVQVAFNRDLPDQRSLTIVGNWFTAESVSAAIGQGYRHTIFTRHAPSVQSTVELFEEEFKEALKANKWKARESPKRAIKALQGLIDKLRGKKKNKAKDKPKQKRQR